MGKAREPLRDQTFLGLFRGLRGARAGDRIHGLSPHAALLSAHYAPVAAPQAPLGAIAPFNGRALRPMICGEAFKASSSGPPLVRWMPPNWETSVRTEVDNAIAAISTFAVRGRACADG